MYWYRNTIAQEYELARQLANEAFREMVAAQRRYEDAPAAPGARQAYHAARNEWCGLAEYRDNLRREIRAR